MQEGLRRHISLGFILAGFLCLGAWAAASRPVAPASTNAHLIKVDYPPNGALFPPDFIPPLFVWSDSSPVARFWRIRITFGGGASAIQAESSGPLPPIGPIDEACAKAGAVPPQLPEAWRGGHSWRPDAAAWEAIKQHSVNRPALVTITGFREQAATDPVSRGEVSIETSSDPVGAPIFFRDVPLVVSHEATKGVIAPVPKALMPLIAWRLRYVSEPKSRLMMTNIPTCINCHSFSREGKWMGLDVDGPSNDKGLYGVVPVQEATSIQDKDVIHWSSFSTEGAMRFGFMSQISPNGRYVVTSIAPHSDHANSFQSMVFNAGYAQYGFGQVFFPTRGVLVWYDRLTHKLKPLPGAGDTRYMQCCAFWSPDGKDLVFSRALAKNPFPPGQKMPTYADSPDETQIKYDLYRIPFNDGKGGTPERIVGASQNGMSNDFPKVSLDGRWIIFVENSNGLLMRPDSKLYIVPFQGGKARPLSSNLSLMNSWHSFSPNGHWLVFSSKGLSLYTKLFLTHIDGEGNASPAILIENATNSNRAVNIPEFVNVRKNGLMKVDAPAVDYYQIISRAKTLDEQGHFQEALQEFQAAAESYPKDGMAHYYMGQTLQKHGQLAQALDQYQMAVTLDPKSAMDYYYYAAALSQAGRLPESVAAYKKALEMSPPNAVGEQDYGTLLIEAGRNDEAVVALQKAIKLNPQLAEAYYLLGVLQAKSGQSDDAVTLLQKAVALDPQTYEFQNVLGRVLAARGGFADALPHFEKAVELSAGNAGRQMDSLPMLAGVYSQVGRFQDAVRAAQQASDLATQAGDSSLVDTLRARIAYYKSQEAKPQ